MLFVVLALANIVPNQQIEVDVQQLIDLMKTRKQHLENLLNEKMKDFGSICVLEKVCRHEKKRRCKPLFFFSLANDRCNIR